ncbi:hypothetical protein G6F56_007453 [Rhizopus delemar]|uniref:Protein Zds1 C-terminal domain-containing protein n=1 Tax=Rhizopus stolonifer TaxID=4846 RepID=A0A367KKB0_RHIST|nr:hypothetical protein G6F56_007453 [Rhizopus delemar]RCI02675.1 hypothetical protein CU098_011847 [Rhizopus stolonifer]
MNDLLKTNKIDQQITTDQDIYANLLLSNLLDNNELIKEHVDEEKPIELTNDIIWVPAEKHPKIAPVEFAKFIETQGANIPVKRAASLQRRNSVLSQSYTFEEDTNEMARTSSQVKKTDLRPSKEIMFDRDLGSVDDSEFFAPKPDKILLRRSAFSARGRSRRPQNTARRSTSERKATLPSDTWDRSEGVSLYDQPVNMSEWIDLGSVSLESDESSQRGILSRVHDAESQLRSHINNESEETKDSKHDEKKKKRPSMKRPPTVIDSKSAIVEKKPSWFAGLFQAKQGGLSSSLHGNALSNLAILFTRSLKPNNGTNPQSKRTKNTADAETCKKMKPSRLEPSSPTPKLYNSNRLPIHVERAIYRLSHMKLAEPRRPLRQQVMISNLMFWYLSIQQNILVQINDMEPNSIPPMQQPRLQKKPSKMSRFIYAAKKRAQPQEKHIRFDEDDDIPLSYYKR